MGLLLTLAQVLGLGAVVAGIGMVSIPAALIVAGLLTIVLCEVAERRRAAQPPASPPTTEPRP